MEDIILRYLEKEMGPEEQVAFEKRLDAEPELAQLLEEELRVHTAVVASAYLDRKERLKTRPIAESASIKPLFARPAMYAVAAAVVLLLAFAAIQLMNKPLSDDEIFAQNYQTVPFPSSRTTEEDPFQRARNAYQKRDYQQAILQLEVLLADSSFSLTPQAYYFQGLSHLEMGDPSAATESLNQVSEGSVFGQGAHWHSALAYIKIGNQEEAKKALQQLLKGPVQTYQAQARVLLESMD